MEKRHQKIVGFGWRGRKEEKNGAAWHRWRNLSCTFMVQQIANILKNITKNCLFFFDIIPFYFRVFLVVVNGFKSFLFFLFAVKQFFSKILFYLLFIFLMNVKKTQINKMANVYAFIVFTLFVSSSFSAPFRYNFMTDHIGVINLVAGKIIIILNFLALLFFPSSLFSSSFLCFIAVVLCNFKDEER